MLANVHLRVTNGLTCARLPQRVHLDISVGDQAVDYAVVAKREKLTELQLRVRQLLDQVEQISKEQNYQRVSTRRMSSAVPLDQHQLSSAVPFPAGRIG